MSPFFDYLGAYAPYAPRLHTPLKYSLFSSNVCGQIVWTKIKYLRLWVILLIFVVFRARVEFSWLKMKLLGLVIFHIFRYASISMASAFCCHSMTLKSDATRSLPLPFLPYFLLDFFCDLIILCYSKWWQK